MSYDLHDQIFDEFCKMCPWAAPKVSKWYETGNLEIIIELKDGSAMHYDYILKAFRYEPSLDELLEKLKVHDEEEWRMEFARRLYKKCVLKAIHRKSCLGGPGYLKEPWLSMSTD